PAPSFSGVQSRWNAWVSSPSLDAILKSLPSGGRCQGNNPCALSVVGMTLRSPVMGWAAHYHAVAEERRCASQQKLRADVADGSPPVIRRCRLNVRFAHESGPD